MDCTSEPGSFRDRNGRVYMLEDAVYRGLSRNAVEHWKKLSSTRFLGRLLQEHKVVQTEFLDQADIEDARLTEPWAGYLKHEKIPFVSYPYEWCFEMLKDAALLHLELMEQALDEGMILKDSSAFNIQFMGARPIFIDMPSFEQLAPGEPWVGFRQYCQMFLYPLMLQAYKGVPFRHWLRGSLDGIEPADCWAAMSLRDLIRPGVFTLVYLQSKLLSAYGSSTRNVKQDVAEAGFSEALIRANVRKMRKVVSGLHWKVQRSEWSDYVADNSYDEENLNEKKNFVREAVQTRHRKLAWDIGCNTGTFSRILAENCKQVVAMDIDHLAVQRLYVALRDEGNTSILPLVCNLADPSPNQGWRGLERKSLPARGAPELTLCLALIHHIVIGANIPLNQFIEWMGELGTDLVLEMVTKQDEMVQKLLLNKDDIYQDYSVAFLEQCLGQYFDIQKRIEIKSGLRILYYATAIDRSRAARPGVSQ
jgi:hypothetical protein